MMFVGPWHRMKENQVKSTGMGHWRGNYFNEFILCKFKQAPTGNVAPPPPT